MGALSISAPIEAGPPTALSRTQLIFALTGMVLTLLTAAMDQAFGGAAMPRAIATVASNPAKVLGLNDRGQLKPGYPKDDDLQQRDDN